MFPKRCSRPRKLPIPTTIRRGNMTGADRKRMPDPTSETSPISRKNLHELLRRNDLKLSIGAIARLLVRAPSSEVRHVTEAVALHVFVGDFYYELGPERLPREVFPLTPSALSAWYPMFGFSVWRIMGRPTVPRMIGDRILAIRR